MDVPVRSRYNITPIPVSNSKAVTKFGSDSCFQVQFVSIIFFSPNDNFYITIFFTCSTLGDPSLSWIFLGRLYAGKQSMVRMESKLSLLSPLRMMEPPHCVESLVVSSPYSCSLSIYYSASLYAHSVSFLSCSVFKPVRC